MHWVAHGYVEGLLAMHLANATAAVTAHGAVCCVGGVVKDLTTTARRAGIRHGMKRLTVERMAPACAIFEPQTAAWDAALGVLRDVIYRFTPWVEVHDAEVFFSFSSPAPQRELQGLLKEISWQIGASDWRLLGAYGPSKLVAKMGTQALYRKQNWGMLQLQVKQHAMLCVEDATLLLQKARVRDLWAVSHMVRKRLEELGIRSVIELQRVQISRLQAMFGQDTARELAEIARGEDSLRVAVNFPPVLKQVQWRSKAGEAVGQEALPALVHRLAERMIQSMQEAQVTADRLVVDVEGYTGLGQQALHHRAEVTLAKPVLSAAPLQRWVTRQLEPQQWQTVSAITISLGELRPIAYVQSAWEIGVDGMLDVCVGKREQVSEMCEDLQDRFGPTLIRIGCLRSARETLLSSADPFRTNRFHS